MKKKQDAAVEIAREPF